MEKLLKMLLYVLAIALFLVVVKINIVDDIVPTVESPVEVVELIPTYFVLTIDEVEFSIPIVVGQIYNMRTLDGTKVTIEIPEPGSQWEQCVDCE